MEVHDTSTSFSFEMELESPSTVLLQNVLQAIVQFFVNPEFSSEDVDTAIEDVNCRFESMMADPDARIKHFLRSQTNPQHRYYLSLPCTMEKTIDVSDKIKEYHGFLVLNW